MRFSLSCFLLLSLLITSCDQSSSTGKNWQLTIFDPASNASRVIKQVDASNKLIIINYWAEWCKPCREEIPELNRFAASHADRVVVVGFNFDNLTDVALQTSIKNVGMAFPVLTSDPGKTFTLPDIGGLPTTLILDEHGVLKKQLEGPQTLASLETALLKL